MTAFRLPERVLRAWQAAAGEASQARTLIVFCAAMICAIAVATLIELDSDRERTVSGVMAANVNLARVFEEHVLRTFRSVDDHLLYIKRAHERGDGTLDLMRYSEQSRTTSELLNILAIVDAGGWLAKANRKFTRINLRDREFHQFHAAADSGGLHISKPLVGRTTGRWSVYLSRRLNKPDGSFDGMVVAALDPTYLSDFYKQVDLGADGVVTLVGLDGVIRARQSGADVTVGQNASSSRLLTQLLPSSSAGTYVEKSRIDNVSRIFAYRAVRGYPLVLVVGTAEASALAGYYARRSAYIAIAGSAVVVILGFMAMLLSQMRRQQAATRSLALSEARSRAIFDQAAVGIGEASLEGRWLAMNGRLAEILGYSGDEWRSAGIWEHIHPEDTPGSRDRMRRLVAGESARFSMEKRYLRRDGSTVWVNLSTTLVRTATGAPDYVIGVVEDITARKHSEFEAERLRNELEDRVARRTAELAEANRRLESFSYSVSHDLRTPLRAISGFAQILARRHRAALNEEGRHYMDNIVRASTQMGRLIEDLLAYSRLGRSRVKLEAVELQPLLSQVAEQLEPKAREAGAVLSIAQDLPAVRGDQTLLLQIFTNLIDNAIQYRRAEVTPVIEVAAERREGKATVSVADNGIGIPSEHLETIFGVFQRLHTEDEYPGTGIGLATVKQAADMLGAQLSVTSRVGEGSAFHLTLELASPVRPDVSAGTGEGRAAFRDAGVQRMRRGSAAQRDFDR